MSSMLTAEPTVEYCGECKKEFVRNAGRYIFDDNAYCPECWDNGRFLVNTKRGTRDSSLSGKRKI